MNLAPLSIASTLLALALHLAPVAAATMSPPPPTPQRPVTDTYFGTAVVDPYRWMESRTDGEFERWAKAQADHTAGVLQRLSGRERLRERLTALSDGAENVYGIEFGGAQMFFMKAEAGRNSARLFQRSGLAGADELLLDPQTLPGDSHWAIDYFTPSPDGKYLAVGLSQGGSENSEIRVLRLSDRQWLDERLPRAGLNERGLAWLPDGSGFFYNQLPDKTGQAAYLQKGQVDRYTRSAVRLHRVGEAATQDAAVFGFGVHPGRAFDAADVPYVATHPSSAYALGIVDHGDSVNRSYYVAPLSQLRGKDTPWRRVAGPKDLSSHAYLLGDSLYQLTHKGAPRYQLTRTPLAAGAGAAKVVIAGSALVLRDAASSADALYVRALDGGVNRLMRVQGDQVEAVKLPFDGTVTEIATDTRSSLTLVKMESWLQSAQVFRIDGGVAPVSLLKPSKVDTSAFMAERVMVKSHDGVEVPLSILRRKDLALDGQRPTLMNGYGAYGIVMEPRFNAGRLAWLELGGVLAIAHVRGGGEFGEAWHQGAHILNKVNTIKDFIACGEYLVAHKFTSPARLGGAGGSAGGITIGGAITQRPDLFAVAHSSVGLSDMLRMELTPNGPPNIQEFGTVRRKDHFQAMHAISPVHRVRDGVKYPAVIVTTGMNDPRVDAWIPAKFAARLQAAGSDRPVLFRVDFDAGHGMGSTRAQRVAETADVWSFMLWQMGVEGFGLLP